MKHRNTTILHITVVRVAFAATVQITEIGINKLNRERYLSTTPIECRRRLVRYRNADTQKNDVGKLFVIGSLTWSFEKC